MTPGELTVTDAPVTDERLAELLAAVVAGHPSVVRLDGGIYGAILTYLPGGRLVGVRLGTADEPVEIAVVLRLDQAIPETVAQLRTAVAAVYPGPVDITVSDVVTGSSDDPDPDPATGGPGPDDPGRPE